MTYNEIPLQPAVKVVVGNGAAFVEGCLFLTEQDALNLYMTLQKRFEPSGNHTEYGKPVPDGKGGITIQTTNR